MKSLPQEILDELAKAGFVHITGLPIYMGNHSTDKVVEARGVPELGRYGNNNGKTALVTSDGQVWLKSGYMPTHLVDALCPNGTGVLVPCTNGDWISSEDILDRLADPYCKK